MGSIFAKLSEAKGFNQSKWFTRGIYIAQLDAVKFISGGHKGDSFVIESTVLGVKNTDPNDVNAPKVGDSTAHIWNATGPKADIARNTWMAFMTAVFGCKNEDYTDAEWEEASADVIDNNSLDGKIMYLEVFNKETKAGGDFTYHAWKRQATPEDLASFGIEGPESQ